MRLYRLVIELIQWLNVIHNCIFKALKVGEVLDEENFNEDIEEIVNVVRGL
jgi:hypothetical protein